MDGELLRFAPPDVAAKPKVALAAVRQNSGALQYVPIFVADEIRAMLQGSQHRADVKTALLSDPNAAGSTIETEIRADASAEVGAVEELESPQAKESPAEGILWKKDSEGPQMHVECNFAPRASKLRGFLSSGFGV